MLRSVQSREGMQGLAEKAVIGYSCLWNTSIMYWLLIPAVGIISAWIWGASKVGTPPLPHDAEPPTPGPKLNTGIRKIVETPAGIDHFSDAVMVTDDKGVQWLVAREQIGPVGIGQAADMAKAAGGELPTPALSDAIWRAADLKLVPMPRSHNVVSPAIFADQQAKIKEQIAGRDFTLLGGAFKDVVMQPDGFAGLYGWHVSDEDAPAFSKKFGIPLLKPKTPGAGKIIQPMSGHAHGLFYSDYSQGVRLVKKAPTGVA